MPAFEQGVAHPLVVGLEVLLVAPHDRGAFRRQVGAGGLAPADGRDHQVDASVPQVIQNAYPDTEMLVADPAALATWLPADTGTQPADHIYLVDPNGNLMMRFPKDPDPGKIKNDLTKLLKWSRIG